MTTIRELKNQNQELKWMLVVAIIGILVLGCMAYIFGQQKLDLESQLQECQGKLLDNLEPTNISSLYKVTEMCPHYIIYYSNCDGSLCNISRELSRVDYIDCELLNIGEKRR